MKRNCRMAMHIDFVDLRLFVNIAETNSLTRAADRSHMCLSAASILVKHIGYTSRQIQLGVRFTF